MKFKPYLLSLFLLSDGVIASSLEEEKCKPYAMTAPKLLEIFSAPDMQKMRDIIKAKQLLNEAMNYIDKEQYCEAKEIVMSLTNPATMMTPTEDNNTHDLQKY